MSIANLDILIQKLKGLKSFAENEIDKDMSEFDKNIVGLNKEQLLEGKKATGELIQPEGYATLTAFLRHKKGLQIDHVDLKYTGKFQGSMYLEKTEPLTYKIDAKDPKYEAKLLPKYGDILGLNEENIKRIGLMLQDLMTSKLQKYFII